MGTKEKVVRQGVRWSLVFWLCMFIVGGARAAIAIQFPEQQLWVQGTFRNRTGIFLNDGDLDRFEQMILLEGEKKFSSTLSLTLKLRYFWDNVFDVQGDGVARSDLAKHNLQDTFALGYQDFVREAYVDWNPQMPSRYGQFFFRGGKQLVTWGVSDGFRLLDLINPFDFREPLLAVFDEAKIPLWMVRIDYFLPRHIVERGQIELLYIPFYQQDTFPPARVTPWSFRAFDLAQEAGDVLGFRYLDNLFDDPVDPPETLENSQIGLRWSHVVGQFSYTLNYLYGWTSLPHAKPRFVPVSDRDPLGFVYDVTPDRIHVVGGSFDYTFHKILGISNVVLRSEVAFKVDNVFYGALQPDLGVHYRNDSLEYVIGLDKVFFGIPLIAPVANTENFFSVQLFQTWLTDFKKSDRLTSPGNSKLDDFSTGITAFLQNTSMKDRLVSEVLFFYGQAGEFWFRPRFSYDWSDAIRLELGGNFFLGHKNDFIGGFADQHQLFVDLRYQFM